MAQLTRQYQVETRFTFTGVFFVNAESKKEAIEMVEKNCGLVMGGDIHTSDEQVTDWNFDTHPEKKVVSIM